MLAIFVVGCGTAVTLEVTARGFGPVAVTSEPDGLCGPPVDHPDDHGKKHKKEAPPGPMHLQAIPKGVLTRYGPLSGRRCGGGPGCGGWRGRR
jgi:hypothetical protein